MDKVSIVIPIYNEEEKLERLLQSVCRLTYPSFEVILINDGSMDNSKRICEQYVTLDYRFRLINQNNRGKTAARNKGLEYAQGKWIWFIDADDEVFSDALDNFLKSTNETNYDCIIGKYVTRNNDYQPDFIGVIHTKQFLEDEAFHRWTMYHCVLWNKLFRRDIIETYHILFNEEASLWAQDNLFILEYMHYCNKIYCIEDVIYYYDVPENAHMSKSYETYRIIYNIQCIGYNILMELLYKFQCSMESIAVSKNYFYVQIANQFVTLMQEPRECQKLMQEIWKSPEMKKCLSKDDYEYLKCKELYVARFCYKLHLFRLYKLMIRVKYRKVFSR